MKQDQKHLGQIGYEAYCNQTGWKSLATGAPLPAWQNLPANIQQAWQAAANAVIDAHIERK